MGAPDRITINTNKFIGIGIGFDTFPYTITIYINIPFLCIQIGLGKPYYKAWEAACSSHNHENK
jgi:hypothetical protein